MMQHHNLLVQQIHSQLTQPAFFNAGVMNLEVTLFRAESFEVTAEYTMGLIPFMAHLCGHTILPFLGRWDDTHRVELRIRKGS